MRRLARMLLGSYFRRSATNSFTGYFFCIYICIYYTPQRHELLHWVLFFCVCVCVCIVYVVAPRTHSLSTFSVYKYFFYYTPQRNELLHCVLFLYIHTYKQHTHTHVHIHTYTHTYRERETDIQTHTHTHTHTRTYTQAHRQTHTNNVGADVASGPMLWGLVQTWRCWRSNSCSSFDSPASIFAQCSWALCGGGGGGGEGGGRREGVCVRERTERGGGRSTCAGYTPALRCTKNVFFLEEKRIGHTRIWTRDARDKFACRLGSST